MKRFQECNKIVKIWRYRWYLAIPFQFLSYKINGLDIWEDEIVDGKIKPTGNTIKVSDSQMWGIFVGDAQSKMEWYHTAEEVKASMEEKFPSLKFPSKK